MPAAPDSADVRAGLDLSQTAMSSAVVPNRNPTSARLEDRAHRQGGSIGAPCGEVTRTATPTFLSASRRRVQPPTPAAHHLPA